VISSANGRYQGQVILNRGLHQNSRCVSIEPGREQRLRSETPKGRFQPHPPVRDPKEGDGDTDVGDSGKMGRWNPVLGAHGQFEDPSDWDCHDQSSEEVHQGNLALEPDADVVKRHEEQYRLEEN